MLPRRADAAVRTTLLVLLASLSQLPTANAEDSGHARRSAPAAAASCASCHGQAGEGNATAGFPRLQGLPAAYQIRQLAAFADGTRQSAVMAPLARSLGARERAQLADYYATLGARPRQPGNVPARGDDRLALYGRWSEEIPACVQCHGENGSGIGAAFPALAAPARGVSRRPAALLAARHPTW